MLALTLALLLTAMTFAFVWLSYHYSYWQRHHVPHERPVFLLGNMGGIGRLYHWKDINQRIYQRFKGSARFVGFFSFFTKAAFILDLDLVKHIMIKDFGSFSDRGLFNNERDDPLTGNLLFLDGEQWRTLRHKLTPVFTTGKMKFMFPTIVEVAERLRSVCEDIVENEGGVVELKDVCGRYTTDVIGTCAFGIECNSLRDPNAQFHRMARSIFERPRHNILVQSFMFTNPSWARRLRMKNFRDEVSEFFMNAVRETVEYRIKEKVHRNDFMDMLIELKLQRDRLLEQGAEDMEDANCDSGLTLEQVAAQTLVFFLAGSDTSSTTLSFCLYELALNQKVQDTLRREIIEVLKHNGNQLTYESVKQMTYLEMVLSETLRKYSVVPHIARCTVSDYRVPDSDVVFEKGLRIIIPVDAIHKDPDYYPLPEVFDPERFQPEELVRRPSFAYLPFGYGPRNCIGLRFGKMQIQIALVTLISHYRFTTTRQTQIPLRFSKKNFLVATECGIHLKMEQL